jgi:hypothetical protein
LTGRFESALFLLAAGCLQAADLPLDSLYETNQWFQLRDAVRKDKTAPAFYRGMVGLAFHDWEQAERNLRAAANSAPRAVTVETMDQASQSALAMEALSDLYFLTGRYKDAAEQFGRFTNYFSRMASNGRFAQESSRALRSYRALYAVLSHYPDQSVIARGYSRLPFSASGRRPIVRVALGGNESSLMLDTGSGANFINPSEARRLGLTVLPASVPLDAYDGVKEKTKGVAVADQFTVGNFRLRNVAFFVLSGDDPEVPGILGLPMLFALGNVRWSTGGMLELGLASKPGDAADANLAYHGGLLLTEAVLGTSKLTLSVDTGTDETLVYPSFAKSLGGILHSSIGQEIDRKAIANQGVKVRVAGFDALLGTASPVLTTRTGDFDGLDGNLGLDILGQGSSVAFDFANGRLRVETDRESRSAPESTSTPARVEPQPVTLRSANLPDTELREILKASVEENNLDFEASRDYVYLEDREIRYLDAKGDATDSHTETRESMELYGERYERLVRKDGEPLAPKQERSEQEKFDKETNKRKEEPADAKAKRLAEERRKSLACDAEFIDAFRFRVLGTENVNGRPAWKVEADPTPDGSPDCAFIKKFRLQIWIDQADRKWAKVEGDNVAPVTWGGILVRAPAGALHLVDEMTRNQDGAWLPAYLRVRIDAKLILLKTVRIEVISKYSDYRRFRAESRIVE